jgi:agmatine deiminase
MMDPVLAMPPEWGPHECCVLAWPCRASLWRGQLSAARRAHAATVAAIAPFEPVLLVAAPGDGDGAGAACPAAEVVEWPIDDSWARDIGAIVVTGDGTRAGVDFVFNGWGGKFTPYDEDARFAARMCAHLALARIDASPFVLEGGAITVDGAGTVITTEQCLLNPNRNPALTREQIEDQLRTWLGVDRVVWLPHGLVEDDDTDGHVDNVAACLRPGVVLAQTTADPADPNHARLRDNVEVLAAAGYDVVEIDVLPSAVVDGQRVVIPPTNLYLAQGAAIVPVVEGPAADAALAAVRSAVPEREVVGVDGTVLAYGGGGVHCITQQVPR